MAEKNGNGKVAVAAGLAGLFGAALVALVSGQKAEAAPGGTDNTELTAALNGVSANISQLIEQLQQSGGAGITVSVLTPWVSKEPEPVFSQAIRSVGTFQTDRMLDCRSAKRIYIKIESSLNQPVTLQPIGNMNDDSRLATSIGLPRVEAAGANDSWTLDGQNWAPFIGLTLTTLVAPTAGILNIWITLQE